MIKYKLECTASELISEIFSIFLVLLYEILHAKLVIELLVRKHDVTTYPHQCILFLKAANNAG